MLTPAEMEDLFEKIDRRLDRIEQILPTLATKADLQEAFADATHQAKLLHEDLIGRITLLEEERRKRR